MLWTRELASRVSGEEVVMNLVNPGTVDTGLHRDGQKTFSGKFMQRFDQILGRTPEEGGRLVMDGAVVKGKDTHGEYLSEAKLVEVTPFIRGEEGKKLQKKLWDETLGVLREQVGEAQLDELLGNLK